MTLYYIANIRLPNKRAHGIQLIKMSEALVESGVNLKLLVPFRRGLRAETLQSFYGLKSPIPLRRLPVVSIFPKTRFGFNLRALTFAVSYFFYLLMKRLAGEKAVIYTIDLDQFSFFLIPLLGSPYFFETHATKEARFPYRYFLKKTSGIIAINNWIKNDLISKFNLNPEKVTVFPNGIDLEMFDSGFSQKEARAKLNLPPELKIIVYIGRFYDWKGLSILPRAAEFLPENFVFYLVGGTERQFKDIVGVERLPQNIVCAGERDYGEMPLWLIAADLLLVLGTKANSYSYYQTSPMKIFEYMASRRPILASRTPAVQEIVTNQEAIFYEPDKAEDLAANIRSAFDNSEKLKEVSERAYIKVREFSWRNRAQAVEKFIKSKTNSQ